MVGGVADLGLHAAYPVYCFPQYSSCRVLSGGDLSGVRNEPARADAGAADFGSIALIAGSSSIIGCAASCEPMRATDPSCDDRGSPARQRPTATPVGCFEKFGCGAGIPFCLDRRGRRTGCAVGGARRGARRRCSTTQDMRRDAKEALKPGTAGAHGDAQGHPSPRY